MVAQDLRSHREFTFARWTPYCVPNPANNCLNVNPKDVLQSVTCGGEGGGRFRRVIHPQVRLTAIEVGSGIWIDSIEFFFQGPTGATYSLRAGGLGGGSKSRITLGPSMTLTEINLTCGKFVDSIQFRFSDGYVSPKYGGDSGVPKTIRIPSDSVLRGFYGGMGNPVSQVGYVDRIGFLYSDRIPVNKVSAVPTPVKPPPTRGRAFH